MDKPERLFAFRLATLLHCTVDELMNRLSRREFLEWMAFYQLEPWGFEVEEFRNGLLASIFANAFRGKKSKASKPSDFMIKTKKAKRNQEESKQAIAEKLRRFFAESQARKNKTELVKRDLQ